MIRSAFARPRRRFSHQGLNPCQFFLLVVYLVLIERVMNYCLFHRVSMENREVFLGNLSFIKYLLNIQ